MPLAALRSNVVPPRVAETVITPAPMVLIKYVVAKATPPNTLPVNLTAMSTVIPVVDATVISSVAAAVALAVQL